MMDWDACDAKVLDGVIDLRYAGSGGMPYDSPEARAYRIAAAEMGKEHPDVYERATQILHKMEGITD